MSGLNSKIHFELWSPLPIGTGTRLLDISGIATNRQVNKTRNDADEISFDLDLRELERLAKSINLDPATILIVNQTEVRVSSRGIYIAGGQVNLSDGELTDQIEVVHVKAYGFLNIFSHRYSDYQEDYQDTEITAIVTAQLNYTQALPNGNLGITVGHIDTIGQQTWEFRQQDLKSGWQDLANLQVGGFDMEITADKILNLFALQGAYRSDILLEYGVNVKTAHVTIDGTQSANEIIALGAGIGAQATVGLPPASSTQLPKSVDDSTGSFVYAEDNIPAQLSTTLLQEVKTYNGIIDSDVLQQAAISELSAIAFPVLVLSIEYELNGPYLSDLTMGDYIPVDFSRHPLYRGVKGYYRLERIEATIDDDDNVYATIHLS